MTPHLASWNDTPTKRAIVEFVAQVSDESSPNYVPPEARIAVYDNDGTLWCEKPMPIQADFILRRLAAMADQDPALRERQPWKAAYEKDYAWLNGVIVKHYHGDESDVKVLLGGVLKAFEGITIEAFEQQSGAFLRNEQHPTLHRPYLACGYKPMVELLRYLEAHGFTNYIASGGGRDFIRPITQEVYGIPPERVIGSTVSLSYREHGDGGDLIHKAEADVLDDGPAKPVRIWSRIGRRPIVAGGNSNGDIPMLQFARPESRPSLRLLLRHDDPIREFDYVAGAEKSLELAHEYGWTVVSIKNDWSEVFEE